MHRVQQELGFRHDTLVLDVGGTREIWDLLAEPPSVVFLNLRAPLERSGAMLDVIGDACRLPFKDRSFDVVFSNSLIEHLYSIDRQYQFAEECRRVGRRYFVQSPNRHFPIEPHLLTPFIHWIPQRLRSRLLRNFTVWGWVARPSIQQCQQFVSEVRMVTGSELRAMFPDASIWRERVVGLTKSVMAVGANDR
jgi:SAM-dependent methyltransferase